MQNRWKAVKDLFLRTLRLDPEERDAYLDTACGGDAGLRAEVEVLLASDRETDTFMETGPLKPLEGEAMEGGLVGTRLGKYHITGIISSGGMGTVYEAMQETPKRKVAVKVLKGSIASKALLRRFEYESQILARLRHPGIAQVIEAGTHGEGGEEAAEGVHGIPYFVMEYVPGALTLIEYAERKRLDARQRIRLFLQVCAAVHHGHLKGIIHRDLKPSNLLVDESGVVKVIDFGVARVRETDPDLPTLFTSAGQLIGTLQYMSPEQCDEDPHSLDFRSDVYALGVVLYELLCRALPYDVRNTTVISATRTIREQEPVKPSLLDRGLRGDLETILLKALEKQKKLRYQTAMELSGDLERFLRGDLILARPAGPATRLSKQIRRHPIAAASLAAAFLFLLLFFSYVVFWSYPKIRAERDKAEAVDAFLVRMLESPNPFTSGRDVTMVDLLDEAEAGLENELSDQPEVRAFLRFRLGWTYYKLGRLSSAESQLRKALHIYRGVVNDEEMILTVMIHLIRVLQDSGRYGEAEALITRARTLAMSAFGEGHIVELPIMKESSLLLFNTGKYMEAERLSRATLRRYKKEKGPEAPGTLAEMRDLSNVLRSLGRFKEAEALLRGVLAVQERIEGEGHLRTAYTLWSLTNVLMEEGRFEEAREHLKKVIDCCEHRLGPDHPSTMRVLGSMAAVDKSLGRYEEAEALFDRVLENQRRILGEDHKLTLTTMNNLANFYRKVGKPDRAEALHRRTLDIRRRVLGEDHPDTLESMNNLANLLRQMGKMDEAEPLLLRAVDGRRRVLGEEHYKTMRSMHNLARLYSREGKTADALPLYRKCYETFGRVFGETHENTFNSMNDLAITLDLTGRSEEAEALFRKMVDLQKETLGEDHAVTLRSMRNLAIFLERKNRFGEAEPVRRGILETRRRIKGREDKGSILAMNHLAETLMNLDRAVEAAALLDEAAGIAARSIPKDRSLMGKLRLNRCRCHIQRKEYDAAEALLKRGYEGMEPGDRRSAVELFISLYEAWGREGEAKRWRARRDEPAGKEGSGKPPDR